MFWAKKRPVPECTTDFEEMLPRMVFYKVNPNRALGSGANKNRT